MRFVHGSIVISVTRYIIELVLTIDRFQHLGGGMLCAWNATSTQEGLKTVDGNICTDNIYMC